MKTVVLTSEENFVWHSMQEIIPAIERTWSMAGHPVECFNIDKSPLAGYLPQVLLADNIVLTCFNHKIAQVAKLIRQSFHPEARFFIYLHNQSTIGCWPFHSFGLAGFLRSEDVFLSSCSFDLACFKLCFENARAELIPFTEPPEWEVHKTPASSAGDPPFIYVGRISEQKNLHSLLQAFAQFLAQKPEYSGSLEIYGGEDNLGSPNMGKKSGPLRKFLSDLCRQLKVEDRVHFHGFRPRQEVQTMLQQVRHIFISPSLHSDENFGMAAFYSLRLGQQAVLTRWGGHTDFEPSFPGQVHLVNVYGEKMGPWLDTDELVEAMFTALQNSATTYRPDRARYQEAAVGKSLSRLAGEKFTNNVALVPASAAARVLAQREAFKDNSPCQIFSSYADPAAQLFFAAYGMRPYTAPLRSKAPLILRPWAVIENGRIIVHDVHRGEMTFAEAGEIPLKDQLGNLTLVSRPIAETLLRNGWASLNQQEL